MNDILVLLVLGASLCVFRIIIRMKRLIVKKRCNVCVNGLIRKIEVRKTFNRTLTPDGYKDEVYYAKVEYEYDNRKFYELSLFGMREDNAYSAGDKIDIYVNPKCCDEFVDEKSRIYGYELKWSLFYILLYLSALIVIVLIVINNV